MAPTLEIADLFFSLNVTVGACWKVYEKRRVLKIYLERRHIL
jgi:hypothetical protein